MQKGQGGSSMLLVIFAVAASMTAVALVATFLRDSVVLHRQNDERGAMISLARNLSNELQNTFNLQTSADASLGPANAMLYYCAGYAMDESTTPQCLGAVAGADKVYSLALKPAPSYAYPTDKGAANDRNCPRPADVSCLLAGSLGNKQVGYNFRGDSGTLSADFPLQAEAFFRPLCAGGAATCLAASSLQFWIRITHRAFSTSGELSSDPGRYGQYPKEPEVIELSPFRILGDHCNDGAKVVGYSEGGGVVCECQYPWTPTGQSNARGIICQDIQTTCPPDTIQTGIKSTGELICQSLQSSGGLSWNTCVCLSTLPINDISNQGSSSLDCSACKPSASCRYYQNRDVGGMVASMDQRCESLAILLEKGGKHQLGLWTRIAVISSLVIMALPGGLVYKGAIVLYMLAKGYTFKQSIDLAAEALFGVDDWHIEQYPTLINCKLDITCRTYNQPAQVH